MRLFIVVVELRHILCPIEVSDISEFALTYAAVFAGAVDARLTALHVVDSSLRNLPDVTPRGLSMPSMLPEEERELRDMVRRCAPSADVRVVIVEGIPADEIVEQAKRLSANLIIIGTHGRKGLKHLLLGSVAERVLRSSPVPVMTLRKPGATQED